MDAARREKADDRYRPRYHYVNPEYTLNDPTGRASGQGRWHLFYHARPPEDPRQHWGHAVSPDLIHWWDLPYAIGPGPEERCYSGPPRQHRSLAHFQGSGVRSPVPRLLADEEHLRIRSIAILSDGRQRVEHGI